MIKIGLDSTFHRFEFGERNRKITYPGKGAWVGNALLFG